MNTAESDSDDGMREVSLSTHKLILFLVVTVDALWLATAHSCHLDSPTMMGCHLELGAK